MNRDEQITYSILDPTGNITALVESHVEIARQPSVAAEIMRAHPEVEQVGFVTFPEPDTENEKLPALRMAGGEFCGNASMCAAALYVLGKCGTQGGTESVTLAVSGATDPVRVELKKTEEGGFAASVAMPPAVSIRPRKVSFAIPKEGGVIGTSAVSGLVPYVRMEGISHIIIEEDSLFYALREQPEEAEKAIRSWYEKLREAGVNADPAPDGLGILFLAKEGEGQFALTPLVYVPGSGTCFWEHSCASGTSAAAMYLAKERGKKTAAAFTEPGGILRAESDPETGATTLSGTVRLVQTCTLKRI